MKYTTYQVKVFPDGKEEWRLDSELYRENGPAITHPDGTKYWCRNNLLHREDGPAVMYPCGNSEYYLNGKIYTKEQWGHLNKIVEIDGRKYQLKAIGGTEGF